MSRPPIEPRSPARPVAAESLERRVMLNAPGANWQPLFVDEFDGDAIDRGKWATTLAWGGDTGDGRHHNDAYASYITDDNVVVSGGTLKLTTQRERVSAAGRTFDYTQGMIQTANQFRSRYGHFEIRAKLPVEAGPGLWPAFWTLADGWPPEDDIGEWWTSNGRSHQGLAYGRDWQDVRWDDYNTYGSLPGGWHTWAMEWGPDYQHFLIDGRVRHTVRGDAVPDVPQYVILNSGVESAAPPTAATVFPNAFEVDYVRVYGYADERGAAIANPDFEADPQGASWNTNGNATVVGVNARTGSRAMRMFGEWGYAEQLVENLRPNTTYTLAGHATLTSGAPAASIGVKGHGSADASVSFAGTTSYAARSLTFTTGPDATSAHVFMVKPWGGGEVYFDDLSLSLAPRIEPLNPMTIAPGVTREISVRIANAGSASGLLDVVVTCDDPTLLPADAMELAGTGTDHTLSLTPAARKFGTARVTVTATDPFGGRDEQSFDVQIADTVGAGEGAAGPGPDDDVIRLVRNGDLINVFVNGAATPSRQIAFADAAPIIVDGGGGNDRIEIDFGGGTPAPAGGLSVLGGDGLGDELVVSGTNGDDAVTLGDGVITFAAGGSISYAQTEFTRVDFRLGRDVLSTTAAAAGMTIPLTLAVSGGTLALDAAAALPALTSINLNVGILRVGGSGSYGVHRLDGTGVLDLAGGSVRLDGGAFAGSIAGRGTVIKDGADSLTLSGANKFRGLLTVADGVLRLANRRAIGRARLTLAGDGEVELAPNLPKSLVRKVRKAEARRVQG